MEEIVHIVPLGWESDRAVLPIRRLLGHRVYLLCHPASDPMRSHYLESVRNRLERSGVRVVHVDVDSNLDVAGMLSETSRIILKERVLGNRVLINIASAGKVAAVAVSIAAMAHLAPSEGRLYYPVAKSYSRGSDERKKHGIAVGMDGDPRWIPMFRIPLLPQPCGLILGHLASAPGHVLGFQDMIEKLRQVGVNGFVSRGGVEAGIRAERNRRNSAFNKKVVQRLVSQGLAEVSKEGRDRSLKLTEAGIHYASLSGPASERTAYEPLSSRTS